MSNRNESVLGLDLGRCCDLLAGRLVAVDAAPAAAPTVAPIESNGSKEET